MTTEARDILVRYRADASGLRSTLRSMDSSLATTARSLQNVDSRLASFGNALRTLGGLYGARQLLGFAHSVAEAADEVKTLDLQITKLSNNTGNFDDLYRFAQQLGIGLKDAGQQLNLFAPALAKIGLSFNYALEFAGDLNKSLRLYGVEARAATSVTTQLAQALTSGTLAGDELKSLRENAGGLAIELERAIQELLGTDENLKKLGSSGALTAQVVTKAWAIVFQKLRADFRSLPETVGQQEARMRNAATRLFSAMDDAFHVSDVWKFMSGNLTARMEEIADRLSGAAVPTRVTDPTVRRDLLLAKELELLDEYQRKVEEIQKLSTGFGNAVNSLVRLPRSQNDLLEIAQQLGVVKQELDKIDRATAAAAKDVGAAVADDLEYASQAVGILSESIRGLGGASDGTKKALSDILPIVRRWATAFDVPEELLTSVLAIENGFKRVGESAAGAKGPMQFIDTTAAGVAKQMRALGYESVTAGKIQGDFNTAIMAGAFHLAELNKKYGGWTNALIAYNASFKNVGKEFSDLPKETQNYVNSVIPATAALIAQTKGFAEALKFLAAAAASQGEATKELAEAQKYLADKSPVAQFNAESEKINALQEKGIITRGEAVAAIERQREAMVRELQQVASNSEGYRTYQETLKEYASVLEGLKDKYLPIESAAEDAAKALRVVQEAVANLDLTPEQGSKISEGILRDLEEVKSASDTAKATMAELGAVFSSAFEEAVLGGESLSDIFKGLEKDIIRIILRMYVLGPLMKTLFGNSSGDGGLLSGIFGGIFGGAKALGGPVNAGTSYLVGERGPELFVPSANGRIIPNNQLTVNVSINDGGRSAETRSSAQQLAAAVGRQVQRAMARNL